MSKTLNKKEQDYFKASSENVHEVLKLWVFRSIELCFDATKSGDGTPLSAFILTSCAIDALAGFYSGRSLTRNGKRKKLSLRNEYRAFMCQYMPQYPADKIYKALRSSLIHNYSLRTDIALTHNNSTNHLKQWTHNSRGKEKAALLVNFEDFYKDFQNGTIQYFTDLQDSQELKRKFLTHYRKFGFAGPKLAKPKTL